MSVERKEKQWVVFGVGGLGLLILLFGFNFLTSGNGNKSNRAKSNEPAIDTTIINQRTSGARAELDWVEKAKGQVSELGGEVAKLRKELEKTSQQHEKQLENVSKGYDELLLESAQTIDALKEQKKQIAEQLTRIGNVNSENVAEPGTDNIRRTGNASNDLGGDYIRRPNASQKVRNASTAKTSTRRTNGETGFTKTFKLNAPKDARTSNVKNYRLGSYIPAGSYVPAVVIAGVDASVGVSSQSDPKPVLFRITGNAVTAGFSSVKGARINIKGCIVSGAASGDISSERVHVRLTQMTCQNWDSTVFETRIAGHMVSSGKAGLRGRVVSREGPSVRAAAVAGVLQGVAGAATGIGGQVGTGLTNNTSVTDIGAITQNAGKNALAGGLQGAANTLADYYIDRAEQYQPVISMHAGSKVELVFLEGVHLE